MSILPVIDLKAGIVVHAVAGDRSAYQPISSCLAADAHPGRIARGLLRHGFGDVYVADLDAIRGAPLQSQALLDISSAGLQLFLDAGIEGAESARRLRAWCTEHCPSASLIVASESIREPSELTLIADLLDDHGIFSLDLRGGKPLARCAAWNKIGPLELVEAALSAGFQRLLILDLARVGTDSGPGVLELCSGISRAYPGVALISGGGVRGPRDVQAFREAGCSRVLVASALHDGRISHRDVEQFQVTASLPDEQPC